MKILEEMGIIYVVPKIGYFVAKQRITKNVNTIRLMSEIIKDNASTYETKLLKFIEIEADKYLCRETNLPPVSYTHLDVYKRQGVYTVTGILYFFINSLILFAHISRS